uniref:Uncharacterized protein n=1 Tax=Ignisphaera aggregans TaxID=334771 RepID=A0A7C2ZML0_9CREN
MSRGQSELLTAIVFVGLSLVIGAAMLGYYSAVASSYREQLLLAEHLRKEASSVMLSIISYDNRSSSLWILLKRLDGSSSDFLVAIGSGGVYLGCSDIAMYNPYNDDGIACNDGSDCISSQQAFSGDPERVYVPWEGGISDFKSYAVAMGYPLGSIHICRVPNVCRFGDTPGICQEGTVVRVQLPSDTDVARIFIATMYSNKPYIVSVHEVPLR